MANTNVAATINQARQQGIPDEQILSTLRTQGALDANNQPVQSGGSKGGFNLGSLVKDPINELLVKPAVRATQAVIGGVGALTHSEKAQKFAEQDQNISLPGMGKFNVPAQKTGTAGAKQIAGGALKTAAYLAPGAGGGGILANAGMGAAQGAAFGGGQALEENAPAGDVLKSAGIGALAGGVIGGGTAALSKGATKLGSALTKEGENLTNPALELTKAQRAKFSPEAIQKIEDTVNNYFPKGSKEAKITFGSEITHAMNDNLNAQLTNEFQGVTIPKDYLLNALLAEKSNWMYDASYPSISKAIDATVKDIQGRLPDDIPLLGLQELKQTTTGKAYAELGGKVTNQLNATLGDIYKNTIEAWAHTSGVEGTTAIQIPAELQAYFGGKQAVPISEYNKVWGDFINANKFVNKAAPKAPGLVSQLTKKAVSSVAGGVLGHAALGPLGGVAGAVVGPQIEKAFEGEAVKSIVGGGSKIAGKVATNLGRVKVPQGALAAGLSTTGLGKQKAKTPSPSAIPMIRIPTTLQ